MIQLCSYTTSINVVRQKDIHLAGKHQSNSRTAKDAPWVIDLALAIHAYVGLCKPDDDWLNSLFGLGPL